jgi:hypothetical protein
LHLQRRCVAGGDLQIDSSRGIGLGFQDDFRFAGVDKHFQLWLDWARWMSATHRVNCSRGKPKLTVFLASELELPQRRGRWFPIDPLPGRRRAPRCVKLNFARFGSCGIDGEGYRE